MVKPNFTFRISDENRDYIKEIRAERKADSDANALNIIIKEHREGGTGDIMCKQIRKLLMTDPEIIGMLEAFIKHNIQEHLKESKTE